MQHSNVILKAVWWQSAPLLGIKFHIELYGKGLPNE